MDLENYTILKIIFGLDFKDNFCKESFMEQGHYII